MQKVQKKDEHSTFKSEFWGICCESGKKYSQVVRKKFHISMAALDPTVVNTSPCVSLMVERGGSQYMLCSLKPDAILQVTLNLFFDKGEKVTFFLKGQGTVHLSGYHICDGDLSCLENSIKGQINSPMKKDVKKTHCNFQVETSEEESSEDEEDFEKAVVLSSVKKIPAISPGKPLNVSVKATPKVEMSEESSEDESEDESDKDEDSKKLKTYAAKRVRSSLEEESSDMEESSEESSNPKKRLMTEVHKKIQSLKKLKTDASTPKQSIKPGQKTINKPKVINLEEDDMDTSAVKSPVSEIKPLFNNELNTSTQSMKSKKKKKKKSKAGANDSQVLENTPGEIGDSPAKSKFSRQMPGGLECDDIRAGSGPVARKGKLVHVYYTGKLENNKVFDSCQQGSKPFSFKLGAGQVIQGWDLGIEGMKVGGKRKLKIPPSMGYKSQRMGTIPPNSTLYFVVELRAVS